MSTDYRSYWTFAGGVALVTGLSIVGLMYLPYEEPDNYISATNVFAAVMLGTIERQQATSTGLSGITTNVTTNVFQCAIPDPSGAEYRLPNGSSTNYLIRSTVTNVYTNISTNYSFAVSELVLTRAFAWSPGRYITGYTTNIYTNGEAVVITEVWTNDAPLVFTNTVTNAITPYDIAGQWYGLGEKIKELVPYYVNTNAAVTNIDVERYTGYRLIAPNPERVFDAWTVTGLFMSLGIGNHTNLWTVMPATTSSQPAYVIAYTSFYPTATEETYVFTSRQEIATTWVATNYVGNYQWGLITNASIPFVLVITNAAIYSDDVSYDTPSADYAIHEMWRVLARLQRREFAGSAKRPRYGRLMPNKGYFRDLLFSPYTGYQDTYDTTHAIYSLSAVTSTPAAIWAQALSVASGYWATNTAYGVSTNNSWGDIVDPMSFGAMSMQAETYGTYMVYLSILQKCQFQASVPACQIQSTPKVYGLPHAINASAGFAKFIGSEDLHYLRIKTTTAAYNDFGLGLTVTQWNQIATMDTGTTNTTDYWGPDTEDLPEPPMPSVSSPYDAAINTEGGASEYGHGDATGFQLQSVRAVVEYAFQYCTNAP